MRIRWTLAQAMAAYEQKHGMLPGELSLRQLDEISGVSYPNIQRIKADEAARIDRNTLARLCRALECQPCDLIALEND